MTGFVTPDGNVWGRPVGVTVAKNGALLVTDDGGNCILYLEDKLRQVEKWQQNFKVKPAQRPDGIFRQTRIADTLYASLRTLS